MQGGGDVAVDVEGDGRAPVPTALIEEVMTNHRRRLLHEGVVKTLVTSITVSTTNRVRGAELEPADVLSG